MNSDIQQSSTCRASTGTTQANPKNSENSMHPHTQRQLGGAAVAGGIGGLVLGGPILAVVAAGGAALAVTSKGKPREVARECGDAMATTGDRIKKFDRKHCVVEKTSKGIANGCNWISKKHEPPHSESTRSAAQSAS